MNFHRGVASLWPNPGREVSEESARERTRTPRLGFVSTDHLPIGCLTFPELRLVGSRPCSVAAFMNSGNYATPEENYHVEFPRKLYIISNIEAKSLSRSFLGKLHSCILYYSQQQMSVNFWSFVDRASPFFC